MSEDEARQHISELNNWTLEDNKIEKSFKFSDFVEAMKFVNSVGHHPDIHISYNKVKIVLWTHAVGGLSINDFIVAAKIDKIKE